MNAPTDIFAAQSHLSNLMHDAGIVAIERWQGGAVMKITMEDGCVGHGWSVREAVDVAVRKAA